jgi:hypothetical protein
LISLQTENEDDHPRDEAQLEAALADKFYKNCGRAIVIYVTRE